MLPANKTEVWLRGPVPGIPPLLQPVAHALLQAKEEVNELMEHFPDACLWVQPAGLASAGFHLQHLSGVLDRLFTYAQHAALNPQQLTALQEEGNADTTKTNTTALVRAFNNQVDVSLQQLAITDERLLTEYRTVGRAQLPSTLLGLLFHAAEHTMRHVGQLLVTVHMVTNRTLKQ